MTLEKSFAKDVKGDGMVARLQNEIFNLFMLQEAMLATDKETGFRRSMGPYIGEKLWRGTLLCQLQSIPYFGYLRKKELIENWLLPEVGSTLKLMGADKVIITNELDAIPISECVSHGIYRKIQKKTMGLYQRQSQDVIPILRHADKNKVFLKSGEMINQILQIVATGPRIPLKQL